MIFIKRIVVLVSVLLSFFMISQAVAHSHKAQDGVPSPWFTGPLLAPSGHTIPAGHTNIEPYLFYTDSFGRYNHRGKRESTIKHETLSPTLILTRGLSSCFDLQAVIPFDTNWERGQSDSRFGDATIVLGYQLLAQKTGSWIPDLRLVVEETFPIGHYENLNPNKSGTDATGAGSYQTAFGANFQRLWAFSNGQFLRGRLSITYAIPTSVDLQSFNAFGGGFNTDGKIDLGNHFSTDLAFEYTVTQHWVPAIDILYVNNSSNRFTGNLGVTSTGLPAKISINSREEWSIAPAIEYNFTSHLGIILGGWFTLTGQDATEFSSAVFALNYYD